MPAANELLERALNETANLKSGEVFLIKYLFLGYEWNRISRSDRLLLGTLFFLEHQHLFEGTKLMDFWIRDNQELVKKFREEFCKAHNRVAKRTMTVPIPE